jgi:hypothetical protein
MADPLSITNVPTHLGMLPQPARDDSRRRAKAKRDQNSADDATEEPNSEPPAEVTAHGSTGTQVDVEA